MNIYIEQIKSIALPNKYTKWYCLLVESRRLRASNRIDANSIVQDGYTEEHHILPKDFGLGGIKDKENYVYLTGREHFIAHRLLFKMFIGTQYHNSTFGALGAMGGREKQRGLNSHQLGIARKAFADAKRGVARSPETRKKLSESNKGKVQSPESIEKRMLKIRGRPGKVLQLKRERSFRNLTKGRNIRMKQN